MSKQNSTTHAAQATPATEDSLVEARADVARLEAERSAIPAAYQQALASGDVPAMRAARARQVDIGDQIAAAAVLAARLEIEHLERRVAAETEPGRYYGFDKEWEASKAELAGVKERARAMETEALACHNATERAMNDHHNLARRLRDEELPAAVGRLESLLRTQEMGAAL